MNKLFFILTLFCTATIAAQDYKTLKTEDIIIIHKKNYDNQYMRILKKDSTSLASGYYKTPYENGIMSFYIAPNGKLNNTSKLEIANEGTMAIPFKNDIVDGTVTLHKNDKLIAQLVFIKGILKISTSYDKQNRTEKYYVNGIQTGEKLFEGNVLVVEKNIVNSKSIEKQYKDGRLVSSFDEATDTTVHYDDRGTIIGSVVRSPNGDITEKGFDIAGRVIMQKNVAAGNANSVAKYFNSDGKLIKTEEGNALTLTRKFYDTKGKVIKTESEDIPAEPTVDFGN